MATCTKRERIDIEGNPRRSLFRKEWERDGIALGPEFFGLVSNDYGPCCGDPIRYKISEAEWLHAASEYGPAKNVPKNSAWDDGVAADEAIA